MTFLVLGKGLLKSKFQKVPFSANFKVTERCNLKCPWCSIWRLGNRQKELSLQQIKIAADNLRKVGLSRIVITGGEPMLRKDLTEIISTFATRGISTTLLTNGILSRDLLIKELFEAGLEHLGVSLDFLTPSKQDTIYNHKGAWYKIEATIKSAIRWNNKGFVYVMTTLLPENIKEIIPLFWKINNLGAHFVINPVMSSAYNEPDRIFSGESKTIQFSDEQITAIEVLYGNLIKLKRKGKRILASEKYLRESLISLKSGNLSWKCHAGIYYFNIFSDGGVAPCNEYPSVISVIDNDFKEKFFSQQFQQNAEFVRKHCSGCNLSCWRELSYLITIKSVMFKQAISILKQKI